MTKIIMVSVSPPANCLFCVTNWVMVQSDECGRKHDLTVTDSNPYQEQQVIKGVQGY